jgi:membrane protein implicated in regulation of membrane protease activity
MEGISDLYAAHAFWTWAALAAGLLAIEVLTGSGWLLWAAASAGVTALIVLVLRFGLAEAMLAFALLTIVSTLLARRYLRRAAAPAAGDINDTVARLLGHKGAAVRAFEGRAGRVFVDGKEWAAELADGEPLEAGAPVEVVRVEGARLTVRRA